jgi:hypothetical protein
MGAALRAGMGDGMSDEIFKRYGEDIRLEEQARTLNDLVDLLWDGREMLVPGGHSFIIQVPVEQFDALMLALDNGAEALRAIRSLMARA